MTGESREGSGGQPFGGRHGEHAGTGRRVLPGGAGGRLAGFTLVRQRDTCEWQLTLRGKARKVCNKVGAPLYSMPHFSLAMTGFPVRSLRKGLGFTGTVCTQATEAGHQAAEACTGLLWLHRSEDTTHSQRKAPPVAHRCHAAPPACQAPVGPL